MFGQASEHGGRPAAGGRDPRDIVTPDAFHVAPALLGRPLASPWRRGLALLIDLGLVLLLTEAGGVFFGLVAAVAFFCIAVRKPVDHWLKRWVRGGFALLGAGVLFLTVLSLVYEVSDIAGVPAAGAGWQWGRLGMAYGEQDPAERAAIVQDVLLQMGSESLEREELEELIDSFDLPPGIAADLRLAVGGVAAAPPPPAIAPAELATTLDAYTAALRAGDEAAIEAQAPAVRQQVAGAQLAQLEERLSRLQSGYSALLKENQELAEQAANPSLRRVLSTLAGDLGLTLGWSGVYFTFFLAWWRGRTPGKRLLHLRVVRLDDRPLGLWAAFERFAGYAAGLASGLLGFLQILWDPNRQGLQDKIVGTVVVVER